MATLATLEPDARLEARRARNRAYNAAHREEQAAWHKANRVRLNACERERRRLRRERGETVPAKGSPEARYRHHRASKLRRYNLTEASYDARLAAQGGVCAICRQPEALGRALSIDHDHRCCPDPLRSCGACVRGLLCSRCNQAVGLMADEADRLRAAAGYLESFR